MISGILQILRFLWAWACTGFDGDHAVGEAIRRVMRQIPNLNINAEDYDLALAAVDSANVYSEDNACNLH